MAKNRLFNIIILIGNILGLPVRYKSSNIEINNLPDICSNIGKNRNF